MKSKSAIRSLAALLGGLFPLLTTSSQAAPITWATPVNISDVSDVATTGTARYAYCWGPASTVNGVGFQNTTANYNGNIGASAPYDIVMGFPGGGNTASAYGSGGATSPYGSLDVTYQNIIKGGVYCSNGTNAAIKLQNLTVGHNYLIQIWDNDSRAGSSGTSTRTATVSSTNGNSQTLAYYVGGTSSSVAGGLGQFAVGTFTADNTNQYILITSSATLPQVGSDQLNAIQVRDTTPLNGVWIANSSGLNWSTPGNWTNGNVAYGQDQTADFSQLNIITDPTTVHLNTTALIGNLIFGDSDTSSPAGWVLDNNGSAANVLDLATSAGTPTITVNPLASGKSVTISAAIGGTNGLIKNGSGILVLSGINGYSGPTTVEAGELVGVTGGSCDNSPITFAPAAGVATTNAVAVSSPGTQWSCGALTNTAGSGSIYAAFDFGLISGPSTTLAPMLINGDANVSGTLNVIVHGGLGWVSGQSYPLIAIVGAAPASMSLALIAEPSGYSGGTVTYDPVNKVVNYTVSSTPQSDIWNGASGSWDVNTSPNWLSFSLAPITFKQFDYVIFDDTPGSGTFYVTKNATVMPSVITMSNNVANYVITGPGAIAGAAILNQDGAGTLALNSSNSYTGGTTLENGTLIFGNANAIGSGSLNLSGGGFDCSVANLVNANNNQQTWNNDFTFVGSQSLNLGNGLVAMTTSIQVTVNSNTLTVGGPISGAGSALTKAGDGTLKLANSTGSYSGGNYIYGGTVQLGATNALGFINNNLELDSVLDLNGFPVTVNSLTGGSGGVILNNSGSGQSVFTFGIANGSSTFSGLIEDNSTGTGTVTVAKVGTGNATLSSSNSYSGPTTITAGGSGILFTITDPHAFGNSIGEVTEVDNNNCVLLMGNLSVSNKTINIWGTGGSPSTGNGNGSLEGNAGEINQWAGTIRMGSGTTPGRLGVRPGLVGTLIVSGSLKDGLAASGAGLGLVANCDTPGSAVVIASPAGANKYSGQTQIGRGILQLGATNTLPLTNVLNIGTAGTLTATFDLNGFDQIVGGLTHSGANGATLLNSAAITNTLTVNQNTSLTYGGTISGGSTLNIVKAGTGTLTLTNDNSNYSGLTTISNGTLLVNNAVGLGSGTGPVIIRGGMLGGVGIIGSEVTNQLGGTFAPGTNGVGTLTFNNTDLALLPGSFTAVEVNKTLAACVKAVGLNSVTYGGTLVVSNLSGTLSAGDTFSLFSAATQTGNFTTIVGSLGAGLGWNFTNGILSVVNLPTPASTLISSSINGKQFVLNWPAGQGWGLQIQTNGLGKGISTNWYNITPVPVPPYTNSMNQTNGAVFFRLFFP